MELEKHGELQFLVLVTNLLLTRLLKMKKVIGICLLLCARSSSFHMSSSRNSQRVSLPNFFEHNTRRGDVAVTALCLSRKISSDHEYKKKRPRRNMPNSRTSKNSPIDMYAASQKLHAFTKSDRPDAAEQAEAIFQSIPSPNTVTYNNLINFYAERGNAENSFNVFHQMQSDFESGINYDGGPDIFTHNLLLKALLNSKWPDAIEKAENIISTIPSPNSVTYTLLMNIYTQYGSIDKAVNLFYQMQLDFESGKNTDCRPNMHTYTAVLNALQRSTLLDATEKAEHIFSKISLPVTATYNALINNYARSGDFEKAQNLLRRVNSDFESGKNKDCRPDMRTYNIILHALLKSKRPDSFEKAEHIFNTILFPDTVTYNTFISIYGQKGDFENALNLFHRMQSDFLSGNNCDCCPDTQTYNTILSVLQKSDVPDVIEKAKQIFDATLMPDTVTYSTLIDNYAQKGEVDIPLNFLNQMQSDFESGKNNNCCPDKRTYNTILKALLKSNRPDAAEKAEQIFSMVQSPDKFTYNTLINIYGQNGDVENALNLFHQMQTSFESGKNAGCRPDMHAYSSVLNILQKSKLPDAAEKAKQIFETVPYPNTIVYTAFLNIYANRGMGKDAISLIRRMQSDFESGKNRNCRPNNVTKKVLEKALRIANDSSLEKDARDVLEWFRKRPSGPRS
jgi:pentatricopeptide repeat protein